MLQRWVTVLTRKNNYTIGKRWLTSLSSRAGAILPHAIIQSQHKQHDKIATEKKKSAFFLCYNFCVKVPGLYFSQPTAAATAKFRLCPFRGMLQDKLHKALTRMTPFYSNLMKKSLVCSKIDRKRRKHVSEACLLLFSLFFQIQFIIFSVVTASLWSCGMPLMTPTVTSAPLLFTWLVPLPASHSFGHLFFKPVTWPRYFLHPTF